MRRRHQLPDEELIARVRALNPVPLVAAAADTTKHGRELRRILARPRPAPSARAGGWRRWRPRRVVVAATAVAATVVPLAALAAAQDWWFFRFGQAPPPISEVRVVKSGTWDGKEWQLHAYLSSTDGVCFGVTPAAAATTGVGGASACDRIEGVPRTAESKPYTPHGITFMAGSSQSFPSHIVGPVVDTAEEVEIHLTDGRLVRTATFDAPDELGAIRFYATQLPEPSPTSGDRPPRVPITKLIALDAAGEVVACLVVPMPEGGVPLSACR